MRGMTDNTDIVVLSSEMMMHCLPGLTFFLVAIEANRSRHLALSWKMALLTALFKRGVHCLLNQSLSI
jgi:hypothetical protein